MTDVLLINPDGFVHQFDTLDPLDAARELVAADLDVITARHPDLEPRVYVLVVDDWGATRNRPLNRTAWMLYGGSPVYGPALLYRDDGGPLEAHVVSMARRPPDAATTGRMDDWLAAHPEIQR